MITFLCGFVVGGCVCAISAKTLGWFNKEVKAIEVDIAKKVP